MKIFQGLTLVLSFFCLAAQAQVNGNLQSFDEVDADDNGILDMEEARAAFPDLDISDSNGDGWLNHAEIEAAVSELDLYSSDIGGQTHGVVGIYNYRKILEEMNSEQLDQLVEEQQSES